MSASEASTGVGPEAKASLPGETVPSPTPERAPFVRGPWELGGLVTFCSLAVLHALLVKPYASDFAVVHRAAERALHGDELYRLSELNPFKYSPAAAVLLAPLGLLPLGAAHAVWAAISAVCTWYFLAWTVRRTGTGQPTWVAAIPVVLVTPSVLHHFALGQCDAVLLALCALSEEAAERQPWRSGLALAAAALLKLPVLVLLVPALWLGHWRRLAAVAVGLAVASVLAVLRFGGLEPFAQWRHLLAETTPPMLCGSQNQSAWALVCTYVGPPDSTAFAAGLAVIALAVTASLGLVVALTLRADHQRGRVAAFAVALFLSVFLSPLGWWTNLIALAPLLGLLAAQTWETPSRAGRWLGILGLGAMGLAGALNFDTVGRAASDAFLQARHLSIAALIAAMSFALMPTLCARPRERRAPST